MTKQNTSKSIHFILLPVVFSKHHFDQEEKPKVDVSFKMPPPGPLPKNKKNAGVIFLLAHDPPSNTFLMLLEGEWEWA